jgi:hypothetical protein
MGMKRNSLALPFPNVRLPSVTLVDNVRVVWAAKIGTAAAARDVRSPKMRSEAEPRPKGEPQSSKAAGYEAKP